VIFFKLFIQSLSYLPFYVKKNRKRFAGSRKKNLGHYMESREKRVYLCGHVFSEKRVLISGTEAEEKRQKKIWD
jgi:hypothetical protein